MDDAEFHKGLLAIKAGKTVAEAFNLPLLIIDDERVVGHGPRAIRIIQSKIMANISEWLKRNPNVMISVTFNEPTVKFSCTITDEDGEEVTIWNKNDEIAIAHAMIAYDSTRMKLLPAKKADDDLTKRRARSK